MKFIFSNWSAQKRRIILKQKFTSCTPRAYENCDYTYLEMVKVLKFQRTKEGGEMDCLKKKLNKNEYK